MSIYNEKFMDDGIEYYNPQPSINSRKTKKILSDPTKHYPNKDEASLLRKIMSSTGLTEEEIRADKTYRKQLSDAQKAGQKAKRTETERFFQKLIKEACKTTGFAPQHPETLAVLDLIIKERSGRSWGRRFFHYQVPSAKTVVKQYAK